MADFTVGMAEVDYTPQIGLPLVGNFREDYASRGIHDPLFAKAIVIANSAGGIVAMLAVDNSGLDRDGVAMMRRFIASQCDVPHENILIATTHTHSAPPTRPIAGLPEVDAATMEAFLKKAATAVVQAAGDRRPAGLAVGATRQEGISFNRRLKCTDGKTHMNWEGLDRDFVVEPQGPIDPQVVTVSVERQGAAAGALVNFALHPAILAGDNWLYSADFPGCLAGALGRMFGGDFTGMYFNGCCGNVNHIDYQDPLQGRGYQMCQRVGHMLAVAAHEAMQRAVPVRGDRIEVSRQSVRLDRVKISDERCTWSRQVLEKAMTSPTPGQVDGLPDEFYARAYLRMAEKQHIPDEVEVMAIRLGDLAVVGMPGEAFCEFGMEIKRTSPARHTIVIELANDSIGYLPTPESFEQGGYEPTPGSTHYQKDAGQRLTASAMDQLTELFAQ